jgi:heme exporter protein D
MGWRSGLAKGESMSTFVVFAISTGVVVIAVAGAVVLVVLLVTVSMRDQRKRGAERRGEARREARDRAGRAERDRDTSREGGEDLGPDE